MFTFSIMLSPSYIYIEGERERRKHSSSESAAHSHPLSATRTAEREKKLSVVRLQFSIHDRPPSSRSCHIVYTYTRFAMNERTHFDLHDDAWARVRRCSALTPCTRPRRLSEGGSGSSRKKKSATKWSVQMMRERMCVERRKAAKRLRPELI